MKYLIGLKRPHDSFFDPETRLYLHYYNPRDYVDRITSAIERGLKGGTLIDLTQTSNSSSTPENHQEQTPVKAEEKAEAIVQETIKAEEVSNEETEVDLSELTKAELLEYIEKKGISLKDLGVSKNASAAKIRGALEAYLAK